MEHLFAPYQESFDLKQLGFDEPCIASYNEVKIIDASNGRVSDSSSILFKYENTPANYNEPMAILPSLCIESLKRISAPLYQQAFRWFREKKILGEVRPIDDWNMWGFSITMEDGMSPFFVAHSSIYTEYTTYEKAELACLKKLIEIVKNK